MAGVQCHIRPAVPLTFLCCEYAVHPENLPRTRLRHRHCCSVVKVSDRYFSYWRDPICLGAAATYIAYRWLVPVTAQTPFWSGHFADILLIPAGLPLWLWLERGIGWRRDDQMPRWREIAFALVTWTVAAEVIAPRLFLKATGDVWDAVAYSGGAVIAGLLWQGARSHHDNCVGVAGPLSSSIVPDS
jgi:hypothetical protein